jgi:hypothetical protein
MHLCYLDESGTPEIPGTTSHFVLAGLSIPVWHWKTCDEDIARIRLKYGLEHHEIHTAWVLRSYLEQRKIAGFEAMTFAERRQTVEQWRNSELLRLQNSGNGTQYRKTKKLFRNTDGYVHLTQLERQSFMRDIAGCIGGWGFARLFAECVDKIHFSPTGIAPTPGEEALEQVVSRFEHYLRAISQPGHHVYGLLIHDNNETVAKKHTQLMVKFHQSGTLWTDVAHIMETPLFVNSELTSMVQMADLCSYALRRYVENAEETLFDLIFPRADRKDGKVVGVRHFSPAGCNCKICMARGR